MGNPPTSSDPIAPLRAALAGRYEIGREIGQGAFATVYVANDSRHDRQVAIKVLNAEGGSDSGEVRFVREIRMLASLQHPNILPLHDSGHVEALLYYLIPYVSGETLRVRITRERQLPIEAAMQIFTSTRLPSVRIRKDALCGSDRPSPRNLSPRHEPRR